MMVTSRSVRSRWLGLLGLTRDRLPALQNCLKFKRESRTYGCWNRYNFADGTKEISAAGCHERNVIWSILA